MTSPPNQIISFPISREILHTAEMKARDMGILRNSITMGEGSVSGFIGEEMITSLYPECVQNNTYDYDLILSGTTADVKTKRTTVCPKLFYECSVAAYNTRQETDLYIFCRVKTDYSMGWVLGFLPKDEYYTKSTFLQKGQIDPSNNFVVKADCYNVPISGLYHINQLKEYM